MTRTGTKLMVPVVLAAALVAVLAAHPGTPALKRIRERLTDESRADSGSSFSIRR